MITWTLKKFKETRLPDKKEFNSILNKTSISDSDYQHAKKVWDSFQIKDLGEYHDLYLKIDVLLLADVFENFRKACLEYYKLDPAHYFTSPWISMGCNVKNDKNRIRFNF